MLDSFVCCCLVRLLFIESKLISFEFFGRTNIDFNVEDILVRREIIWLAKGCCCLSSEMSLGCFGGFDSVYGC
jgi:hypothetical protein